VTVSDLQDLVGKPHDKGNQGKVVEDPDERAGGNIEKRNDK